MSTILIDQNVPATMRDGVTLYADIYRPAEPGRYPVLLTRLPYGKDVAIARAMPHLSPFRAIANGYVYIVQDCRGRFASEGEFSYLAGEGEDGYDTVEWAASLPYSSGAVGMFGLSYFGWTQWSAAGLRPPHLRAIAPMQTWTDYAAMRFRGGAFELGDTLRWRLMMSIDKTARRLARDGRSPEEIRATIQGIIASIDRLSGGAYNELPVRELKWLAELGLDDIVAEVVDGGPGGQPKGYDVKHAEVDVPSLNVAGWYDVFQQYTIDNFVAARTQARGLGRDAQLIVGPWKHGELVGQFGMMVGDMEFGVRASGATIDLKEDIAAIQLRWFDRWLKGIDNGIDREPPVRLFLTGRNRWIEADEWPIKDAKEQALYLANGASGGLLVADKPKGARSTSAYTYDPNDPAPTLGGNLMLPEVYGPGVQDQRPLSQRADVLTFTGAPLDQPLTVVGRVTFDLWASSSAPDTDFVARLLDVHPDGYMHNLCDSIIRARYRHSLTEPRWLEPGEVYEFAIDLWSIGHVFQPGHRVAIQITSSSFPRWDRNWNTTGDPASATSGQPANQTIYHDAAHPSRIRLPVVEL